MISCWKCEIGESSDYDEKALCYTTQNKEFLNLLKGQLETDTLTVALALLTK